MLGYRTASWEAGPAGARQKHYWSAQQVQSPAAPFIHRFPHTDIHTVTSAPIQYISWIVARTIPSLLRFALATPELTAVCTSLHDMRMPNTKKSPEADDDTVLAL